MIININVIQDNTREAYDAVEFAQRLNLIDYVKICAFCDHVMNLQYNKDFMYDQYAFRCCKCKRYKSIRRNSAIEGFRCSIRSFLLVLLGFSLDINASKVKSYFALPLSSKTIYNIYEKFQSWCVYIAKNHMQPIGGDGRVVSIDETFFGNYIVFGGIENDNKDFFIVIVKNRTKKVLERKIRKYIKANSIIHSDCLKSYNGIENMKECGYAHIRINHSKGFTDEHGNHTNHIEAFWSKLKKKVGYVRCEKDLFYKLAVFVAKRKAKFYGFDFIKKMITTARLKDK